MFKRIFFTKDCFITNYTGDGATFATGSNTGGSEILQLFKISSSPESGSLAHVLAAFDPTALPFSPMASVTASSVLRLYHAQHDGTNPYSFDVDVHPVEQAWDEGAGQDLEELSDPGFANWIYARNGSAWTSPGGYPTGSAKATFHFDSGIEDLELELSSSLVDSASSNGFFLRISPAQEGDAFDYFVKEFHSRQTHFPVKRPHLEVRWDDSTGSLSSGSTTKLDPTGTLLVSLYGARPTYDQSEDAIFRVLVRTKGWDPAVVATASSDVGPCALTNAYYRLVEDGSDRIEVPFGTGSVKFTKLSYDDQGNYFTIDMGSLPRRVLYRIELTYNLGSSWTFVPSDPIAKFWVR